ncbi:hypothetical protein ABB37_02393 [Leptomonas pyrrhocoris]|uniref:Uncharacterized protein n=1 Tax=Leptomonas pyrrhocoris TaxID=157538 RepID=A0A0M9G857_LEPPY|nr:hypothetical protein ABB37_02393 [Leptomonas pyrrhocoris]KPA84416.1 hypothetical protein ABB37_02393 [Leptomonas pyrrhocoris]|eukprot:XP_015662855.1 hypothetical protein ABB37_02393 [Leptomonas pyrrhocoris]
MSLYGNAGWRYGEQNGSQNGSFYGVHNSCPYMPVTYGGSMRGANNSFYGALQRKSSFYADIPQSGASSFLPAPTPTVALGTVAQTANDGAATSNASSYYDSVFDSNATEEPVAPPPNDANSQDTPPPLLRRNSSSRLLRRKVSFSGVPPTLPPEVEPPVLAPTVKRMGTRRLSISPSELSVGNEAGQQQFPSSRQAPPPHLERPPLQQPLLYAPQPLPPQRPVHNGEPPQYVEQQAPYSAQEPPYVEQQLAHDPSQQQPYVADQCPPYGKPPQAQQEEKLPQLAEEASQEGEEVLQQQLDDFTGASTPQPQPTFATGGLVRRSNFGSFSRGNSVLVLPHLIRRPPTGYGPFMPNYAMMPFPPRPVYRPPFNPYRSALYGPYNTNMMLYQRQAMSNRY